MTTPSGIYSVDARSGERTRLVKRGISDFGGTWSPDGSSLAYSHGVLGGDFSFDELSSTLYLASADGRHVRALVGHDLSPGTPAWSPDGRWLAFAAAEGVYLIRPDGSQLHRVYKEDFLYNPPPVSWSPDSRRLAFIDEGCLYLLSPRGGTPRCVVGVSSAIFPDGASWSPDGRRIALSVSGDGKQNGIYVFSLRTHRLRLIQRL